MRKCVGNVTSNCIECVLENKKRGKDEAFLNPLPKEKRRNYNKKRKKAHHCKVGDFVPFQRTQFGTGLKLLPKFFGPYEVIKIMLKDRYDVKKVGQHEGPNISSTAADHMKLWGRIT
ncbi:hypothetical protein AVEN_261587-1 [Araneus ventricosus]|uniref:Uncharacterized protein n=1 Tax=Araneus ventricosus TaxID=182803 RepID=A0A4Y2EAV5_ARAVE|nr:hypothetical protein AVEN_261587-1 [Araneus ventricosus]